MRWAAAALAIVSPLALLGFAIPAVADGASSQNFTLQSMTFVAAAGSGNSANFESEVEAPTTFVGVSNSETFSVEPIPVPEPSGTLMLALGAGWLAMLASWRRRAR